MNWKRTMKTLKRSSLISTVKHTVCLTGRKTHWRIPVLKRWWRNLKNGILLCLVARFILRIWVHFTESPPKYTHTQTHHTHTHSLSLSFALSLFRTRTYVSRVTCVVSTHTVLVRKGETAIVGRERFMMRRMFRTLTKEIVCTTRRLPAHSTSTLWRFEKISNEELLCSCFVDSYSAQKSGLLLFGHVRFCQLHSTLSSIFCIIDVLQQSYLLRHPQGHYKTKKKKDWWVTLSINKECSLQNSEFTHITKRRSKKDNRKWSKRGRGRKPTHCYEFSSISSLHLLFFSISSLHLLFFSISPTSSSSPLLLVCIPSSRTCLSPCFSSLFLWLVYFSLFNSPTCMIPTSLSLSLPWRSWLLLFSVGSLSVAAVVPPRFLALSVSLSLWCSWHSGRAVALSECFTVHAT